MQLAGGVAEVHTVLSPVVAIFNQLELTPEQGMERMGYTESFRRTGFMRCN
jgi:hypothetical protein